MNLKGSPTSNYKVFRGSSNSRSFISTIDG
nr:MAG TPA: hypothetical protein [Caudoviricetes sp.]